MFINNNRSQSSNINDHLADRNKKFFRGHSNAIHPLYEQEVENAIESINSFLNFTILSKAKFQRLKFIFNISAEKCFNNKNNNYSFSEAQICEEMLTKKDVTLGNIDNYSKEVKTRIQDSWEKQVKYARGNSINDENFSIEQFESNHRRFLLRLHFLDRMYYYYIAKRLFINTQ
jgi:hypothetical protein